MKHNQLQEQVVRVGFSQAFYVTVHASSCQQERFLRAETSSALLDLATSRISVLFATSTFRFGRSSRHFQAFEPPELAEFDIEIAKK